MSEHREPIDQLIYDLKERAKELTCLYRVQELLSQTEIDFSTICEGIIAAIPPGWQYVDICRAEIICQGEVYRSDDFIETLWMQSADIIVQDQIEGRISVYYTEERPESDEGPFLKEERKLIDAISDQISNYILNKRLREVFEERQKLEEARKAEWWVILNLLQKTDPKLVVRLTKKMIQFLLLNDIKEAQQLLVFFSPSYRDERGLLDVNQPSQIEPGEDAATLSETVFELASKNFTEEVVHENIHEWITEERTDFLVNTMSNPNYSVDQIATALERYRHLSKQGVELYGPREKSVRNALIRRLLSDQPEYVEVANKFYQVDDFVDLFDHMIFLSGSQGKVGGKSAGLLLAQQIINKSPLTKEISQHIKVPKSWYVTSDTLFHFIEYNQIEDVIVQKHKDLDQVRQEYPYIVQVFKNTSLPPDIINHLSHVLDDFGDVPLIVRSSSLLEDRMGMAFAGKYKSLFIANRGAKEERLTALTDAITEVYASMFGPDPIEYRGEHHLVDQHEEMGIIIQEVVGTRVGPYYFPAYAGVVFSVNEIPWSKRIRRQDGLVRMVPGLGTRAVDRLSDDYPILIAPGQPDLRVNIPLDEMIRYSPKMVDVINMETGLFESVALQPLLKEFGAQYPNIQQIVSEISSGQINQPRKVGMDFDHGNYIVTFNGVFENTGFLNILKKILAELQDQFGYPVDIEFAHDGSNFYLLQCRLQSYRENHIPAEIPEKIQPERLIFSANRYFSNGSITGITHLVYVDPEGFRKLSSPQLMLAVGKTVSRLNKILPRRKFILMGPGRWGSRGERGIGVSVTYADISNTRMLIEVARKQGDYVPDPSFGTHFFQDLVESNIRYLPLYPDDEGMVLDEKFIKASENKLTKLVPEFEYLKQVVHVVDIPEATQGLELNVLMNVQEELAVAVLQNPQGKQFERRDEIKY
jgi:hypothetical protein